MMNSSHNAANCPACRQPMSHLKLPKRDIGHVELDLCFQCQGIWFDEFESYQISPGGIIDLFKLIHAHRDEMRTPHPAKLFCPRCNDPLLAVLDVAKSGRFTYQRCLQKHGRFTVFAQFMIEKGFVRQLAPMEIKALAARVGTIHCSGCGAPVDIRTEAVCSHCSAPIAILDHEAVETALAGYHTREVANDRRDPEALADALLEIERQRKPLRDAKRTPELGLGADIGDLVIAGIGLACKLLIK